MSQNKDKGSKSDLFSAENEETATDGRKGLVRFSSNGDLEAGTNSNV